jgi:radical SAM protein with 4Fe4S-binding SPASM domain
MYANIKRYSEKDIEKLLTKELGERYSSYREKWNNISYSSILKYPLHIDFEINDKCNQSCIMCPRNTKTHPDINYELNTGSVLDYEKYMEIIDEGVNKGLLSINLGAFGEPLINKNVFNMVKYAHEEGVIDSRLITNGLLLDKYIDDIFDSGLVNLFVSIDTFSEEKYLEIRGKGFKKVKNNLLDMIEEKKRRNSLLPIIRVSFIDMDINKEEKDAFVEFWEDKVDYVDIQVYDNFNLDITKPYNTNKTKKWECKSPWARLAILSNGDILPCCNFFGRNIPIGNITDTTIEDAWNSEALQRIRKGILNDSLQNCSICQRIGR